MASTTLILKDQNSIKETRVVCLLTDGRGVRIKIYSPHSVKPKHWSKKTKTVLSANTNAVELNASLSKFKDAILNFYVEGVANGLKVNADYIKDKLKPKEEVVKKSTEFWDIWNDYITSSRSRFTKNSLIKLNSLKGHLEKFEIKRGVPLVLDTVGIEILDSFQTYFFEDVKLKTTTASKYIGVFKMFLNWCIKFKYTTNTDHKQFTAIQAPDTLKVVFEKEDIIKIKNVELGEKAYLNNVRYLLIISTLTGLRYSDFSQIKQEHLKTDDDGTPILLKRQEKTNDFVELPLTPEAHLIVLDIFKGVIHSISNQNMNKYMKELCELAEVNELFEIHEYRGKLKMTKSQPKHELVSTHTGRRTYATNLLLKGVPAETVMLFTGHRDYKSFSKYVNIPKKAKMNAVKMALMG
jgi:integrase